MIGFKCNFNIFYQIILLSMFEIYDKELCVCVAKENNLGLQNITFS